MTEGSSPSRNVLSVDLAHTTYANLGVVLLEQEQGGYSARRVSIGELGLEGFAPEPLGLATRLHEAFLRFRVSILILDGPQGWKDPDNGLEHSRLCERLLRTPGKTGLPGQGKPRGYLPFLSFSIEVFAHLAALGFALWSGQEKAPLLALESFPSSAWRRLGLAPLPSKSRTKPDQLGRAVDRLRKLFPLRVEDGLNHDEVQALVASLSGAAIARRNRRGYEAAGTAPKLLEGSWREGFILDPTLEALHSSN